MQTDKNQQYLASNYFVFCYIYEEFDKSNKP